MAHLMTNLATSRKQRLESSITSLPSELLKIEADIVIVGVLLVHQVDIPAPGSDPT